MFQFGKLVEDYILDTIEDLSSRNFINCDFRRAEDFEDRFFGTDCFIDDVPVDITVNDLKDHNTWYEDQSFQMGRELGMEASYDFQLGIRTGNQQVKFDNPVLVIRIISLNGKWSKDKMDTFLEQWTRKDVWYRTLTVAEDLYFSVTEN